MTQIGRTLRGFLLLFVIVGSTYSQISIGTLEVAVAENFDGMGSAGTTLPVGWAALRGAGSGTVGAALTPGVTDGNTTSGNVFNVGTSAASERALGTLASGTTIPYFGASFTNNTGGIIGGFNLSGVSEQWKSGSSNAVDERVVFEYSFDATSLNSGSWTAVSTFDLYEILTTTTVAAAVDGNNVSNRASITGSVSGLNWGNGSTLWIRWRDADVTGSDGMYAIDDFSITAHAQPPVADGNGTATLVNAGADVLSGKDIFFRNSGSQSVTITVAGVSTGALTSVSIDVPASWTGLVLGNVSLGGAGFGSANAAVVSNTITVTGAAVTNTDVGTITITGLTTPNPTASSDNGNYLFTVKTAKASGTLTAISGSPSSYVVIPIANLKDNTVGVPNDLNSVVAVEGTVIDSTSMDPSGTEIHLQESSNGVRLFYLSSNLGLVQGNKYVAKGTVVNANGRTTIEPPNATSVVANGVGTMPTPTPITLATLLANAESYEGTLVTVQNVSKVSGTWPTVGVNSTNFLITDDASVSQTQLFVDKETNIDGIAEPTFPKDVRGVFSQFASAPYNTGYEILLRGQNDIGTAGTLPVQLSSFTAAADLRGATLTWKTASEVDNAGWEVERRAIGDLRVSSVDYLKLGFVQGAGTSTSTREYTFTDLSLFDNRQSTIVNRYAYRLKQIDRSGSFSYSHEAEVEIGAVAKTFQLSEAYPNPFNPATTIEFSLAAPGLASLKVYNLLGQEVATLFNGAAEAGRLYQSTWDASSVPSGMYFARLESGSSASMKKLMLVK